MAKKKPSKNIERVKMGKKMRMAQHADSIATSVSLVAFLSAISFFFSGLLLTGDIENSPARSVSLSLLFASAFGFLFSALFYSNTAGKYVAGIMDLKQATQGTIISEYFGVYGLIFATPLAIYSYSNDFFMSIVVLSLVVAGILAYQTLGNKTSIIERYFSRTAVILITILTIFAACGQIWAAREENDLMLYITTGALWGLIVILAAISWTKEASTGDN